MPTDSGFRGAPIGPFQCVEMNVKFAPLGSSELSADVTVLDVEPGEFAFCLYRSTLIVAWPKQATGRAVARLKAVSLELNRDPPPDASSVHLVAAGSAVPDADARAAFVDLIRNQSGPLGCLSIVLGGGGFWASAFRSVVLGMRMVTPRSFPLNFHTDTLSSAHWIAKESRSRGGELFKSEDLARAMDEVVRYAAHGAE